MTYLENHRLLLSGSKKSIKINDLKYYTADKQHAFCDAYCSNAWYDKTFKKLDAKKDQSNGNE